MWIPSLSIENRAFPIGYRHCCSYSSEWQMKHAQFSILNAPSDKRYVPVEPAMNPIRYV
jgi:hypothetical protein